MYSSWARRLFVANSPPRNGTPEGFDLLDCHLPGAALPNRFATRAVWHRLRASPLLHAVKVGEQMAGEAQQ
jgi:hypothetical protein